MTSDPKSPPPEPPSSPAANDAAPAVPGAPAANDGAPGKRGSRASRPPQSSAGEMPLLDERRLTYAELAPFANQLDPRELVALTRDGRAVVRANAALGFSVAGHAAPDLVPLLRDSDPHVARAGAEAITRLGPAARSLVAPIAQALDGTQPEITERMVEALSRLIETAVDELVDGLDVGLPLAMKGVIAACAAAGRAGVALLARAASDGRSRVRINAIAGLGRVGSADTDAAIAVLTRLESTDPVPDARIAAKEAILAILPRGEESSGGSLPREIPDFEVRKLSTSELGEYAAAIDVDEMIHALRDGRDHVRVNAARALAIVGDPAGRAARSLALLLRDSAVQVRREVARALGRVGEGAVAAAPELVGALGDGEVDVAGAAAETLAGFGDRALGALIGGLQTGGEEHGRRVVELIGRLPSAVDVLSAAFESPAVNVQVNAAIGLGLLGGARVGKGLPLLLGARTGGDARTRAAVFRALAMLDVSAGAAGDRVAIDGFEDRLLEAAELDRQREAIESAGLDRLTAALRDGRDRVRANAASALGVLGPPAAAAARPLAVLLRDDAARVRLVAAQALDRIGDAAVLEAAPDLVGALASPDAGVVDACAAALRARRARVLGALVGGLETGSPEHARHILALIAALPDAAEILVDAFRSPAVNVQVNAATGLGLLGPARVGEGRGALERARTGTDARTREAVRAALEMLDGPASLGPGGIDVGGFESRILEAEAFAGATASVADLVAYLQDGRAVVRANAASFLGALGPAASGAVASLGVLLRDDDKRVRIRAARSLDRIGDDAVRSAAEFLVGALRGDAEVAEACAAVLASRKTRVLGALVRGLETDDPVHARRLLELIAALPDACEILCDAFESAAENVQVNAATGIGMLGPARAGTAGRKALEGARTGGFARTRDAVFKAIAVLDRG